LKLGAVGLGYVGLCTAACPSMKFDAVGVEIIGRGDFQ
jgi:UDP-N-acetyl-D-mannosaminuronate dehydrogenase